MFDSAAQLDAALARLVNAEGHVDYAALEANGSALACARDLARIDLTILQSREQKLAFWINAYNCLVLAGVLEHLRRNPSYRGVTQSGSVGALRFFYLDRHVIGGRKLSLATIENRILRGELREPRIHFALVCAARSCPRLKHGLYSAEHIDAELEIAAQQFIRSADGVRVDPQTHTVRLSRIFKWYRKDFEHAAGSVLKYVARYVREDERAYLDRYAAHVRIRYFDYDWRLNRRLVRAVVE